MKSPAQAHKTHMTYNLLENTGIFLDLLGLVRLVRLCGNRMENKK